MKMTGVQHMSSSLEMAVSQPAKHLVVASEAGSDDMVKRRRSEARLVGPRSEHELADEWDKVAAERDSLIEEGRDLSYLYILLPALRKLSDRWLRPGVRVLDVGCGTGKFAAELAEECSKTDVVAIDPSGSSIEIAKEKRPELANLIYERSSVESFAGKRRGHFDLILANMLFQNVASLVSALPATNGKTKAAQVTSAKNATKKTEPKKPDIAAPPPAKVGGVTDFGGRR